MSEPFDPNRPGHFCWMELMTGDREKARAFYADIAGWETNDMQMPGGCDGKPMTYTTLRVPDVGTHIAGMMQMDGEQWNGVPPHWMPYLSVADVDAKAQRVAELGGKVHVPPTDIPDIGRFTVIEDPTGAKLALITLAGSA